MNKKDNIRIAQRIAGFCVWLTLAFIIAVKFYADFSLIHSAVSFPPCLLFGALYWLSWAVLLKPLRGSVNRYVEEHRSWNLFFVSHASMGFALSFVNYLLMVIVFELFYSWEWFPQSYYPLSMLLLNAAIYVSIVATDQASKWFGRFSTLELRQAKLNLELAEARLQALRMQLHPHFLFNSLNAIRMLIETDAQKAVRMTTLLGEFLRTTLEGKNEEEVMLVDELKFVRGYLEIQQIRFGDRIRIVFDIADEALKVMVPNLILQPIVENSMLHGCGKSVENGNLEIVATCRESWVVISVRDSGCGELVGTYEERVGLGNTRIRLNSLYGERGNLEVSESPLGETVVQLMIPVRRDDDNRK